ncbi:MAG: tetratricopeptide repeat protein [Anaerolineae bacterium]
MTTRLSELETKLSEAETPQQRIEALNGLAEYLGEIDSHRALTIAEEAVQLSEEQEYWHGYVAGLLNQAWAYYSISDYAESVRRTLDALKLAHQHQQNQHKLDALNILGNNHNVVGNYADAMDCFAQALRIGEQIGDNKQIAAVLSNIGALYNAQEDHQKALQHFERASKLYLEMGAQGVLPGIALLNVAETYNFLKMFDAAIRFAQESLDMFQAVQYTIGEAHAFIHIGTAYQLQGIFDQAVDYFQQALTKIRTTDAKFYEGRIHKQLAAALVEQGSLSESLDHLNNALTIFTNLNIKPDVFATHELYAKVYKSQGDYKKAVEHLELFHEIEGQVFNEKADSRRKTIQVIYEVERMRLEAESQYHRNVSLQKTIQENEQMIAQLDSYADNVAHDLRNPIGVIVSYGALMEMTLEGQLDDESLQYLAQINLAAQKLDDIVGALLSLAKARKAEILPHEVDMSATVSEAQKRLEPVIHKRNAVIQIENQLHPAMGHASWLEEVWVNYIGNAIKYGGDIPIVKVGSIREPDGFIRYWVCDNGVGLKPEEQAQLFTKFERLGQNKIEGHGLGLTIVKTIVEKLGGQVSVSSAGVAGEGSTFGFTLPAA